MVNLLDFDTWINFNSFKRELEHYKRIIGFFSEERVTIYLISNVLLDLMIKEIDDEELEQATRFSDVFDLRKFEVYLKRILAKMFNVDILDLGVTEEDIANYTLNPQFIEQEEDEEEEWGEEE